MKKTESAGNLTTSALDSQRFGIRVVRGVFEANSDVVGAVEEIDATDAELIIFRVPAGETSIPTALTLRGHALIHADTLVYYSAALSEEAAPAAELKVAPANADHRDAITAIAEAGFANYRAHYSANPLIPRDLVLAGYMEWALSRLAAQSDVSATWVVADEGHVAGFATCDVRDDSVEIILNAVHPKFERRGLYGMLLRHVQHHYAHRGLKQLLISTQVWNYTVQRQWTKNGLLLSNAYDTYHLDRRLARQAGAQ